MNSPSLVPNLIYFGDRGGEVLQLAKDWADALVTNDYRLGCLQLRDGEDRYSVFGVACDLIDPNGWEQKFQRYLGRTVWYWNGYECGMWPPASPAIRNGHHWLLPEMYSQRKNQWSMTRNLGLTAQGVRVICDMEDDGWTPFGISMVIRQWYGLS